MLFTFWFSFSFIFHDFALSSSIFCYVASQNLLLFFLFTTNGHQNDSHDETSRQIHRWMKLTSAAVCLVSSSVSVRAVSHGTRSLAPFEFLVFVSNHMTCDASPKLVFSGHYRGTARKAYFFKKINYLLKYYYFGCFIYFLWIVRVGWSLVYMDTSRMSI